MDAVKARLRNFGFNEFVLLVAFTMSSYHVVIGYVGEPVAEVHRPIHTLFAILILYWSWPRTGTEAEKRLKFLRDLAISGVMVAAAAYLFLNAEYIGERMQVVDPVFWYEQALGVGLILLIFEAARRSIGWTIIIVGLVFLAFARFGFLLPDPFYHNGYGLDRIIEHMYLTTYGIWGTPVGVTASFVFLFVLYGSLLLSSGAGDFFTDLAQAFTGRTVGGPAKTAVVSSALMGTISGSSAANVVTTGAFTIPAMKQAGYSADFAGGVEAAASCGGQLMPPVMGSAAFVMMEFLGVGIFDVMKWSILPALLYFISCYFMVDLEARRRGLKPKPDERLPKVWRVLMRRGYLLVSIFALLYYLYLGYTPAMAAFWAIVSLVALVFIFDPVQRLRIHWVIWEAFTEAPKLIAPITVACAIGGMIVGVMTLTALGDRMSALIIFLSGGNVLVTLLLSTVFGVVLGMGMPTTGAYIVLATLLAPAMAKMGVMLVAAHMFLMWVASKSSITPPVAIASYAAAAVANSDPWKTSMTAFRIAFPVFIIPYMFVYGPSLLLIGEPFEIAWSFLSATVGVYVLSVAMIGWLFVNLSWYERGFAVIAAVSLMFAGALTDAIGLAMTVVLVAVAYLRAKRLGREGVAVSYRMTPAAPAAATEAVEAPAVERRPGE
ncbi:MAG: TRAP transporter fused permease subunit [Proteobacteria bacterium]|nr:TRAP transporter fused permease subunit [Pseudomonadota bacterium]